MSAENSLAALRGEIASNWWVVLIYGVIAVLFGLLAIMQPVSAASGIVWAMGVMALVEGVVSLLALFTSRVAVSKGWLIAYAVLSILFGLVAIAKPLAVASVLILLLAAWFIVAGAYRILFAIRVRKHVQGEWLLIVSGLLAIALGVLMAMSPIAGLAVTTFWIGICALVYGGLQVFEAFQLRKLK